MSNTQEHVKCPECDGSIVADHPEFVGDGTMFRDIECEDCDWRTTEEWVLENNKTDES